MKITILGAGAMGSALTFPLLDNGHEVALWGTEYDVDILDALRGGAHPRIGVKLGKVELYYPEELSEALENSKIVILGVSTEGVVPIFRRIEKEIGERILVTISKGLLDFEGKIVTVPEAIWEIKPDSIRKTVAITGPAIAKEVASKNPTKVVFSCVDIKTAEFTGSAFKTRYFGVELSGDIRGSEIAAALKNVYSIAIAWVRGLETSLNSKLNNIRGVIATMAINEISDFVELAGGRKDTVYGLSGLGDLIATFGGGRNGMLGELLGKGLSTSEALEELRKRGVGVVEGYKTAERAYRMLKQFKAEIEKFPLLRAIYEVLYKDVNVSEVIFRCLQDRI